jgi:hypothetical protein
MEPINAALRFSGVRWAVALVLSLAIGLAVRYLLSYPPDHLAQWPGEALRAAAKLIEATDRALVAGVALWLYWALDGRDLVSSQPLISTLLIIVLSALGPTQTVLALAALVDAAALLQELPRPGAMCVAKTAVRVAIAPLVLGLMPLVALTLYDRFQSLPWLRRITQTGRGAWGGWIASIELKKYCQPLPRTKR